MKTFIELKDREDLPESINKKVYVLTMKWKKEIDDFLKNPKVYEPEINKNEDKLEENNEPGIKKRKYAEIEEKEIKGMRFLEKRGEKKKIMERERNKKKAKYERKKDPHHHGGKIREKDGSMSRSVKKKEGFRRNKSVK